MLTLLLLHCILIDHLLPLMPVHTFVHLTICFLLYYLEMQSLLVQEVSSYTHNRICNGTLGSDIHTYIYFSNGLSFKGGRRFLKLWLQMVDCN